MARNDAIVHVAKIVPINWLADYLDMLRSMRAAQPAPGLSPEQLIHVRAMDAAFDQRIAEVSAYLTRLNVSTVMN
jgi:hypothetical protein